MKKLLFVLCLVASITLFYSCGNDDDNENPQTQTETEIVQNTIKGKFFKSGIEAYQFTNGSDVSVWTDIVGDYKYYQYQKGTLQVHPENQYIIIKTELKTIQLWYIIQGSHVYLYTDSKKNNRVSEFDKPKDLESESKEPNKEDGTIMLSPKTHYTLFNNRQPNPMNGYRPMHVMERGTDKHILTFHWYSYERISEIKNIDPKENKNLFHTNVAVWIKTITDTQNKVYAFNTTTTCEVKVVSTGIISSTGMYLTTFSVHLEDEPNSIKYAGTVDMEYTQYE